MLYLREYRPKADRLFDHLPWVALIGPGLILGLGFGGFVARMARSSLLEVIREDYTRTARAKGLSERIVVSWPRGMRSPLLAVTSVPARAAASTR